MCGITGMAGNLNGKHDKIMKQLLIIDSLRGEDSTGIAAVGKFDNAVRVAKHLGDPFQLFQYRKFEDIMIKVNKVFIGHNRYATSGGVSRHSAHPFEFDTLVGVHNGTLFSKKNLIDSEHFKVDSENLYHHIEQRGLDDALKQLTGYTDAWALVWWNKEDKTLNFLRNKERPLYMTRDVDGGVIYWASESWMLNVVLTRNDVKFGDIVMLTEDILYTFSIDDKGTISKPVVRVAKAPEQKATNVFTNNNNNNKSNVTPIGGKTDAKKQQTTSFQGYDEQYYRSKGVVFEVLEKFVDSNGAEFMCLLDKERPLEEIRLYIRKADKFEELSGKKIKADINGWVGYPNTNKGYYKASPWTVIEIAEEEEGESQEKGFSLFPTHKGSFVTKEEWEKMYKDCAWCSSPLVAEEDHEFTSGGQCLCSHCAKDNEVLEMAHVRLMH